MRIFNAQLLPRLCAQVLRQKLNRARCYQCEDIFLEGGTKIEVTSSNRSKGAGSAKDSKWRPVESNRGAQQKSEKL